MKILNKFLLLLVVLLIACSATFAQDEGSKRNALLRRPVARATPKTTTTTVAPNEEEGEVVDEEYDNAEYDEAGEKENPDATSTTTTTSTEHPKKIGPIIRPFRTNDDFLNALKRRQQNAKKATKEKPTPKVTNAEEPTAEESEGEPEAAPVPQSKFKSNNALGRRKPSSKFSKPEVASEEVADQGGEEEAPASNGRRPGRLGLRPRN